MEEIPEDGIQEAQEWMTGYFGTLNPAPSNVSSATPPNTWHPEPGIEQEEHIINMIAPSGGGAGKGRPEEEPERKKKKKYPPVIILPPIPFPPAPEPMPPPTVPPGGSGEPPNTKTTPPPSGEQTEPIKPQPIRRQWNTEFGACHICVANEEAGPIMEDESFPSGDTEPPAHENCRCYITIVLYDSKYR